MTHTYAELSALSWHTYPKVTPEHDDAVTFGVAAATLAHMVGRIFLPPSWLSREEITGLVGLQPLFPLELLRSSLVLTTDLGELTREAASPT